MRAIPPLKYNYREHSSRVDACSGVSKPGNTQIHAPYAWEQTAAKAAYQQLGFIVVGVGTGATAR
jgi:hypothetical protein